MRPTATCTNAQAALHACCIVKSRRVRTCFADCDIQLMVCLDSLMLCMLRGTGKVDVLYLRCKRAQLGRMITVHNSVRPAAHVNQAHVHNMPALDPK